MPGRRVALVRELTKLHEEVLRGTAAELSDMLAERDGLRGECVIVVEGGTREGEGASGLGPDELDDAIRAGLQAGEPKSALAKRLAAASGLPRQAVYDRILEMGE